MKLTVHRFEAVCKLTAFIALWAVIFGAPPEFLFVTVGGLLLGDVKVTFK